MKHIFSTFLSIPVFLFFITGCNTGKNKEADASANTTIATDTAIMITTPVNTVADSTGKMDMATTNPAKKGKKGMVKISINDKKDTGEMDAIDKDGYYSNVYPSYLGGDKALGEFFENNIQYPASASDNGVEGTVNISFTVDEKGKVGSANITNAKIGYGIEEEALRVFNKMPSWKPGSIKGKNVKTRYNLPVRFQLEG